MKEKQNIIPKISNFSISRLKEKSFKKKKEKKSFTHMLTPLLRAWPYSSFMTTDIFSLKI